MILNLVTGAIGIIMLCIFTGFMLIWVPAPPLILIIVGVTLLLIYDFIQTLRFGESGPGR